METKRLMLRRPICQDIYIVKKLWKNETVRKYLGGTVSSHDIQEKIVEIQNHWVGHKFGQRVVLKKSSLEIIGLCGLNFSENGLELSYMFFPQFWGQGFAQEAASASIKLGFDAPKVKEIIAITQKENFSSCNLLNKIGMRHRKDFERFNAVQSFFSLSIA